MKIHRANVEEVTSKTIKIYKGNFLQAITRPYSVFEFYIIKCPFGRSFIKRYINTSDWFMRYINTSNW